MKSGKRNYVWCSARARRRDQLMAWIVDRYASSALSPRDRNAETIVDATTIEVLSYDEIPLRFRQAVTEFRKLSYATRKNAAKRYLKEHPWPK